MEDKLIEAVKKYPCLYDKSRNEYRNKILREKAWSSVASVTGATVEQCQSRWRSLRDRYVRQVTMAKPKLGAEAVECSKWRYMDAMAFLKSHVAPRKTISNMDFADIDSRTIDYGTFVENDDIFFQDDSLSKLENFKQSRSKIENVTLVANDDAFLQEDSFHKEDFSTQESDAGEHMYLKSSCKRKTYEEITDVFTKMMREYVDTVKEIAFTQDEPQRSSMSLVLELVGKRILDAKLPRAAVTKIENKILKLVDEEIQKYQEI